MILCSESLNPMCLVECYPIGVITMSDNGKPDEKIIAIPFTDPNYNCYRSLTDLPRHIFDEMKHFFSVYKQLENKDTAVDQVFAKEEALAVIAKAIAQYEEQKEILKK